MGVIIVPYMAVVRRTIDPRVPAHARVGVGVTMVVLHSRCDIGYGIIQVR